MSNISKVIIAVVIVIIIAGGVLWATQNMQNNNSDKPTDTSSQETNKSNNESTDIQKVATITYDGTAFNPTALTVESGTTVTVVNQSQEEIEFASDPHPVHTDNSELNTGDIAPGKSNTFTATTKGDWGFHDHYDPTKKGTLVVE